MSTNTTDTDSNTDTVDTDDTEGSEPIEQETGASSEDDAPVSANAEAAKYRRQLRATETERDTLAATVQRFQRAEAHRLADRLAEPEDIFTVGGVELADLLGEDQTVDPDLVATAVYGLLESRPGLAKTNPPKPRDLAQGTRNTVPPVTSWSDVIKRR